MTSAGDCRGVEPVEFGEACLTSDQPQWNRRGYQRMARVAWQAPDIVVDFEDGTCARLEAERLLLPDRASISAI